MKTTKLIVAAAFLIAATAVAGLKADEVGARQENQQDRIQQGVASGELTKPEARKLERKHRAIGKEAKADRAANGGKLTKAEKRKINHQQNKESRKIAHKKHNDEVRAGSEAAEKK